MNGQTGTAINTNGSVAATPRPGNEGQDTQCPILVALDGSALAERALPWATRLATQTAAPLVLVRVVPSPLYPSMTPATVEAFESLVAAESAVARSYLDEKVLALRTALPHLKIESLLQYGDPASELLEAEVVQNAQLVVLTTHGYSGLSRWVRGSVADRVLRHGTVPLMLIRPWDEPDLKPPAEGDGMRVLVALDGSPMADQVVPYAARLSRGRGGRVILATVVPPQRQETAGYETEQPDVVATSRAELHLNGLVDTLSDQGVEAIALVRTSEDVAGTLVYLSKIDAASVIAMSTHGRGAFGRWLHGSVADRIAHTAPVPLILFRPQVIPAPASAASQEAAPRELASSGTRQT